MSNYPMQQASFTSRRGSISRQTSVITHTGFALTGVVTTLLGPLLPTLSEKWSLNDAQSGYLFIAQSAGYLLGAALSNACIKRIGVRRTLAAAYALMSVGVASLIAGAWAIGLLAILFNGFALGLTIPTTNVFVSQMNPGRNAAALNVLNFVWCIGAVAGPPAVSLLASHESALAPLLGLAVLLVIVSVWISQCEAFTETRRQAQSHQRAPAETSVWRTPVALVIAMLIFLYVGAENSISWWVASYTKRMDGSLGVMWTLPQSIFWAALLAGRASAPVILRRVIEEKLILVGLILATLGVALLLGATQLVGLLVGAVLAGAGFASVFPTTVAVFMQHFGERGALSAGPVFAMGGLGSAVVPWAVGVVSTRFDSLRAGLLVPFVCCLAMIALQIIVLVMRLRVRATRDSVIDR